MSRKPPSHRGSQRYDPDDPLFVAVHEAGHAVSAVLLGFPLTSVRTRRRKLPNGLISLGHTEVESVPDHALAGKGEEAVLPFLIQRMAGSAAEGLVNPRAGFIDLSDAAAAGHSAAVAVCGVVSGDGGVIELDSHEVHRQQPRLQALLERAAAAAVKLVADHEGAIRKVAALLMSRQELTGDEVAAVVATCAPEAGRPSS